MPLPGTQLDPDAAALAAQMAGLGTLRDRGVDGAREYLEGVADRLPPPPAVREVTDHVVVSTGGRFNLRVYRPSAADQSPGVVYLHGGGWVIGSLATSDPFCRRLATAAGCVVISVDYRLAPEHPFPAAVHDADAALAWTYDNAPSLGIDPGRVTIVGDSAGGNLAAVAARRARDARTSVPARQVLAYPVIDSRLDRSSYARHGESWPLTTADMAWFWDLYQPDPGARDHPDTSPLHGDLAGLPPATLIVAGSDPLRDEGVAYADRLESSGVPVGLHIYPGQIHGFATMDPTVMPRSAEVLALLGAVIQSP